jgi:hypothetical protein
MIKDRVLSRTDKAVLAERSTAGLRETLQAIEKITETETPVLFTDMKNFIINELSSREKQQP